MPGKSVPNRYWIWLNGKSHRAEKNDEYILKFSTLVKI